MSKVEEKFYRRYVTWCENINIIPVDKISFIRICLFMATDEEV